MNKLMLKQVYDLFFSREREKECSNFLHSNYGPHCGIAKFKLRYRSLMTQLQYSRFLA